MCLQDQATIAELSEMIRELEREIARLRELIEKLENDVKFWQES